MAAKDRKKQLARQRYERQQARREAQAKQAQRVKVIGAAVAVVIIAGAGVGIAAVVGGDDKKSKDAAAAPTPTKPETPVPTAKPGECLYNAGQEKGAPKNLGKPPVKPAYKGTVEATVKTNLGDIVLELDAKKAPCTVGSFAFLADKNYFDKSKCHRLVTSGLKVLQCGDPTATGEGGPGYQFAEENLPKAEAGKKTANYAKGTLAMARTQQPGTNGSQFFMVYGDSPLAPDYTVFGKITSGMDLIEDVAKGGLAADGTAPKKSVTIQDVTIAKK